MKNVVIIMVLVAMLVAISGCQAVDGLVGDIKGSAQAIQEKVTTPLADKAKNRDDEIAAARLKRRALIMKALEDYAVAAGNAHVDTVSNNEVR